MQSNLLSRWSEEQAFTKEGPPMRFFVCKTESVVLKVGSHYISAITVAEVKHSLLVRQEATVCKFEDVGNE